MASKKSEACDIGENSPAVQAHLGILQAVIQRMSANSSACKAWCIALVSAVLVLVADKENALLAWIALIPSSLFLVLDAYYLGLEKGFRESYNGFIDKLHRGEVRPEDLYAVKPSGSALNQFGRALASFAVWPLYLMLVAMIAVASCLII